MQPARELLIISGGRRRKMLGDVQIVILTLARSRTSLSRETFGSS